MTRERTTPLVVIGAGGHAREVLDLVKACNDAGTGSYQVLGVFADDFPGQRTVDGHRVQYLGTVEAAIQSLSLTVEYVIAIGSSEVRMQIGEAARLRGLTSPRLVHPLAAVGSNTVLGEGCLLFSHVSVTTDVMLGRHVHLNRGATVGHDAVLNDYVTMHPQSVVSGACHIGDASTLGTNSAVIERVAVGAGCTVGAGAAVIHDVPDGLTVVGVPARPLAVRRRWQPPKLRKVRRRRV